MHDIKILLALIEASRKRRNKRAQHTRELFTQFANAHEKLNKPWEAIFLDSQKYLVSLRNLLLRMLFLINAGALVALPAILSFCDKFQISDKNILVAVISYVAGIIVTLVATLYDFRAGKAKSSSIAKQAMRERMKLFGHFLGHSESQKKRLEDLSNSVELFERKSKLSSNISFILIVAGIVAFCVGCVKLIPFP